MEEIDKRGIEVPLALLVVVVAAVGVGGFAFAPNQDSLRTMEIQNKSFVPPAITVFDENNEFRILNSDNVPHAIKGKDPETGEVSVIATLEEGESTIVTLSADGIWMVWSPEYSDDTDSEPAGQGMFGYVGMGVSAPDFLYGYYNRDFYRASSYYREGE